MEQYEQITLDQWLQWKEDIRKKLEETAGNFVHIGYRLKQIRDSGMYDGAADVFKFAAREFGLGKSTVSRFIAINEKYSEGGNSLELKEEFRGFSSSKLSEMLTLPDSEIQLITEKTTIREIRELKSFNSQETEEKPEEERPAAGEGDKDPGPLARCLEDFFRTRRDMLNNIMRHLDAEPVEYKEAAELMAPSGQASHRKGIIFLFMYDWNTGIKYKIMTLPSPVALTWMELLDIIRGIYGGCCRPDVWGDFYRGSEAEKGQDENAVHARSNQGEEAVATSQQGDMEEPEKSQGDMEAEDVQQLQDGAEDEAAETEKSVETVAEEVQPELEQQLPRQMEITDYPEAMPEERCGETVEEPTEEAQEEEAKEEPLAERPPEAAGGGNTEAAGAPERPEDAEGRGGTRDKAEKTKPKGSKAPGCDLDPCEFDQRISKYREEIAEKAQEMERSLGGKNLKSKGEYVQDMKEARIMLQMLEDLIGYMEQKEIRESLARERGDMKRRKDGQEDVE